LANFLQAVASAVLLAVPSLAQFSHPIHLAKKIECIGCHSTAPGSKSASDNLLPKPEVCVSCHPAMKAPIKSPRALTVSKFNHQLHVKMGPMIAVVVAKAIEAKKYLGPPEAAARIRARHACTGCHTGLDKSDAVSVAAFPHMSDCLTCHSDIDPPYSCAKCHTESPALRPASHTADFVDVHSAGKVKDKTGCAACHGRGFSCLGCH
jgi:hypothetical protein